MKVNGFGIWHLAFATVFILLATLNSAGYRYGASDQAFYMPAVLRHLDPALFPQDRVLIDAQSRLIVVDSIMAGASAVVHASVPHLTFPASSCTSILPEVALTPT